MKASGILEAVPGTESSNRNRVRPTWYTFAFSGFWHKRRELGKWGSSARACKPAQQADSTGSRFSGVHAGAGATLATFAGGVGVGALSSSTISHSQGLLSSTRTLLTSMGGCFVASTVGSGAKEGFGVGLAVPSDLQRLENPSIWQVVPLQHLRSMLPGRMLVRAQP